MSFLDGSSGGFFDNKEFELSNARFGTWVRDGDIDDKPNCFLLDLTPIGWEGAPQTLGWGFGKNFVPSADGKTPAEEGVYLIPAGDKKRRLHKNSGFYKFCAKAVEAGVDQKRLEEEDITVFNGMKVVTGEDEESFTNDAGEKVEFTFKFIQEVLDAPKSKGKKAGLKAVPSSRKEKQRVNGADQDYAGVISAYLKGEDHDLLKGTSEREKLPEGLSTKDLGAFLMRNMTDNQKMMDVVQFVMDDARVKTHFTLGSNREISL